MGRFIAPNGNDITNDSSIVTLGNITDPGFLSLELRNTTYLSVNQGVYSCVIPDENGVQQYLHTGVYIGRFNSMLNNYFHLKLTVLMILVSALPQVSSLLLITDSDAAITLNCTSTGSPVQSVVWRKDGTSLANDSSYTTAKILRNGVSATYDNLLAVNAAPSALVGVYSCIIHDSLGRNSQTATIPVNGICKIIYRLMSNTYPLFEGLVISGGSSQLNVGETVTFTCSFDLNLSSIEWYYDNMVIMRTAAAQLNLTFSPVNDSINNRQYTCRVVTSFGVQEENISIRVQGAI